MAALLVSSDAFLAHEAGDAVEAMAESGGAEFVADSVGFVGLTASVVNADYFFPIPKLEPAAFRSSILSI